MAFEKICINENGFNRKINEMEHEIKEFNLGDTVKINPINPKEDASDHPLAKYTNKKTLIYYKYRIIESYFYSIPECGTGWSGKRFTPARCVLLEKTMRCFNQKHEINITGRILL